MSPKHKPGEWRDYRRDDTRSGHQPLAGHPGATLSPRWSYRLGGSYQEIELIPDGSGDMLLADGGGIQRMDPGGNERWKTKPFGAHWISGVFDLDGDGRLEIVTTNGHEVIIISALDGSFLFRHYIGPPFSNGTYGGMFQIHSFANSISRGADGAMQIIIPCFSQKEVLVYDCSDGAERTRVLHRLWMDDSYHPSIAIGDVNGDGADEIVIARIGGIYVFDPANGQLISQTQWTSDTERRRNYGHFELCDIDGDGALEAVILSDMVSRHVAVLDNDGAGNFQPLWDRFIEHIYPSDSTDLRYTSNSIRDFDGDGNLEIAVSIFNEHQDLRWHTEILRARTGECISDLPNQYLRGVQDVNNDGFYELCLSREATVNPLANSELSVYSVKNDSTVWSLENASFAERTVHLQPHASEFKPDVFASQEIQRGKFLEREGIFLQTESGLCLLDRSLTLHTIGFESSIPYRVAHVANDRVLITTSNGDVTSITRHGIEYVRSCGYHLTPEAHAAARPGSTATVFENGEDRYLAVPDFANRIHMLVADGKMVHKIEGHSRIGYDGVFHAVSMIETKGGPMLVVVDDRGLDHARLSLYSMHGERVRSFDFPDLPASIIGSRVGCYDWLGFEHSRGEALFASFYRSRSMNTECSLAFLIATGEVLWRKDRIGIGEYGRGVGPWGTAALLLKDRRSIAVFCAKDSLCRLDLETGELLSVPKLLTDYTAEVLKSEQLLKAQNLTTQSSIDDPFTAYGSPTLIGDDLVISGAFGGFGVIQKSSQARWWKRAPFGDILYRLPGIGDVDGDGQLEFAQAHGDGCVRIYDYTTGVERTCVDLQATATDILTVDFDGDGREEFVFGTNDGRLIAVGWTGNEIAVKSVYDSGVAMGSPIAADLDGDGASEIYVVSADGLLTCFG
ncbi:MAG: VCBS repeat-containing protein [Bacteroidota bacterium]|nr:VCBS repeat-containing protein [Bacteroidota bacterium]MDP4234111.1 VCBS repeat-containing protein [Bacteroidota bacterium]MDP4243052.1 VCBS repeat-containing protein [Bacteroidota bacterium]MDP4287478.1 VCBS repeat-containing protein [Bacteroidota bacterium]